MSAPSSGTWPSAVKNTFAASGERSQPLALVADRALQPRVQRKAVARQPDRGLQAHLQGELAEFPRQVVEGGRLARNRRRQRSVDRGAGDRDCRRRRGTCRGSRPPAPSRAHRAWSRSRRTDDAADRIRRRRVPSSWARPRPARRTRRPRRRMHCRREPASPDRLRSPTDTRWRWLPCARSRPCARRRWQRRDSAGAAEGARGVSSAYASGAPRRNAAKQRAPTAAAMGAGVRTQSLRCRFSSTSTIG